MNTRTYLGGVAVAMLLMQCGGSSSSTTASTTGVRLTAAGSFSTSASAKSLTALKTTTAQCSSLTAPIISDDPSLADGLDCDGDGGVVAHVTPSKYAIAFKHITLIPASGSTAVDLVADTGTLAKSQVVDFTAADTSETVVTIDPNSLKAGTYTGIQVEMYYFQLTFPVGGTTRNVRTYMSDDDFASEGSLGHHQGDITYIDENGKELGWVDSNWNDTLAATRTSAQNGDGGTDSETKHDRGFFGNTTLWNDAALQQGSGKDIYLETLTFATPLVIPTPSAITTLTTITATFSVADTFYYEDFTPQGTGFSPASGGEAKSSTDEWAPLIPTATIAISTS